ncbi:hypothetical protein OPIT5_29415 [Opitutaceae bacterium TAV5]|nr:hypothetical protein OPIT5_21705 [Opitutaceae bacterium TAV5]AHF94897.1 hypothetical protein OPIT5_29415 [Opitutaceae bacterium TAV5]
MNTTDTAAGIPAELEALIARVMRHQARLKLNNARFVARYAKRLKWSADVWVRTLRSDTREPGRLSARNWGKWTVALRDLVAEIDGAAGGEKVYPLPILAESIRLYDCLQGSGGDIRIGWLVAPTGTGKSVSLRHLVKTNDNTAYLFIPELWRNNKPAILRGLARAIGIEPDDDLDETIERIVARLNLTPMTILLDEVHEGGLKLVKLIKTLIEWTPTRFILTTWPLGYSKLADSLMNLTEVNQLSGRSLLPIAQQWKRGNRPEDIAAWLSGACPEFDAETRDTLARDLCPRLSRWGLRHLTQAVDAARADAGDEDSLTPDALLKSFSHLSADVLGVKA